MFKIIWFSHILTNDIHMWFKTLSFSMTKKAVTTKALCKAKARKRLNDYIFFVKKPMIIGYTSLKLNKKRFVRFFFVW